MSEAAGTRVQTVEAATGGTSRIAPALSFVLPPCARCRPWPAIQLRREGTVEGFDLHGGSSPVAVIALCPGIERGHLGQRGEPSARSVSRDYCLDRAYRFGFFQN